MIETMVSLQSALLPADERKKNNKRKWNERAEEEEEETKGFAKELKLWRVEETNLATVSDIDLHLDTPLPLEWQRCLDIQSGQIHFYNTRTHKRTSRDPREIIPEPLRTPSSMSLDLELNLTCESPSKRREEEQEAGGKTNKQDKLAGFSYNSNKKGSGDSRSSLSSWVSLDSDRREMVARVCAHCHMLVMMCKSAPSCPNCKFVHPPEQSPDPAILKPGFRLLCCKD